MTDNLLPQLYQVLGERAGFEVVNQTVSENQVRIIHRISKEGMPNWLNVMESLFDASEAATWDIDLSKQYFKRNSQVVYGWRIILQGSNVIEQLSSVIEAVKVAPRAVQSIDEQPLVGASSSRRGINVKGKGVRGIAEGGPSYGGPR